MHGQFALRARRVAIAAAASSLSFSPAWSAAQRHAPPGPSAATLEARSRAFLEAVDSEDPEAVVAFFPSSGDFTYVHTQHRRGGNRVGIWRFPAAEKLKALQFQAPLWGVFEYVVEGQTLGLLRFQVMHRGTSWRRAYGTRFVPRGAPASSAAFVEWRREGDRWVVSTFGDESFADLPLPSWITTSKDDDG